MKQKEEELMAEQQMEQPVPAPETELPDGETSIGGEGMEGEGAEAPAYSNPFADRLKKKYPDREFGNDEEVHGALGEYLDELEGYQSSTSEATQKLEQVLNEAPELVAIIRDIGKGASFTEALSRNIDVDELTPMEGDPDYEAWNQNLEGRKKSRAEKEAMHKQYSENIDMSISEVKQFAEENGMSEPDTKKFLSSMNELIADVVDGKLTRSTLVRMQKALNYDMDVQEAAKTAEISAKNEKIEAKRETDKKKAKGDGLPNLTSQGGKDMPDSNTQESDPWSQSVDRELERTNKL